MSKISGFFDALRQIVLPKGNKGGPVGGVSQTATFNPSNPRIAIPGYRDHTEDLFDLRTSDDSRTLIQQLFRNDPDMSAAVNSYLTVSASAEQTFLVRDQNNQIDPKGHELLNQILDALCVQSDYTLGFSMNQTLKSYSESMRYMMLLRGAAMMELVLDKLRLPASLRTVDISSIEFEEKQPGLYKPVQVLNGKRISLDFPTVFLRYYHTDPTTVYSYSCFVAAINTIAARQLVINTLYRIMNTAGAPRLDVEVLEEVALKTMPPEIQTDPAKRKVYLDTLLGSVRDTITSLRSDQAFVHYDSVKMQYVDQKTGRSGMELRVDEVIKTLNEQNQAALKTMSTVIGRGESGANTGSTEARIFALNADELNANIAELWSMVLTFAIRLAGYQGRVICQFDKVELRPHLELEPQRVMKQSRLQKDLSLGLITDEEYHLQMYNRLPPKGVPTLSGTNFLTAGKDLVSSSPDISPNNDPLGRSLAPEGSQNVKSNTIKNSLMPGQLATNANGASIYWSGKRWLPITYLDSVGIELEHAIGSDSTTGRISIN